MYIRHLYIYVAGPGIIVLSNTYTPDILLYTHILSSLDPKTSRREIGMAICIAHGVNIFMYSSAHNA